MKVQISLEMMFGLLLSALIALSISSFLIASSGTYRGYLAVERSYLSLANGSARGVDGVCGCVKIG